MGINIYPFPSKESHQIVELGFWIRWVRETKRQRSGSHGWRKCSEIQDGPWEELGEGQSCRKRYVFTQIPFPDPPFLPIGETYGNLIYDPAMSWCLCFDLCNRLIIYVIFRRKSAWSQQKSYEHPGLVLICWIINNHFIIWLQSYQN